jgi:hypothetical protein
MIERLILAPVLLSGCGYFNSTDGDGGTTPTASGFGQPTLEVTVGGVHAGPVAPDGTAAASLIDVYDSTTGQLSQSSFQLSATGASVGAGCALNVQRYGAVVPLGVGDWQLTGGAGTETGDGLAAPLGSPSVSTPSGIWQCSGDGCAGTVLTISVIDASHVEGYFSGTFTGPSGDADVVCSFYLPMSAYNP